MYYQSPYINLTEEFVRSSTPLFPSKEDLRIISTLTAQKVHEDYPQPNRTDRYAAEKYIKQINRLLSHLNIMSRLYNTDTSDIACRVEPTTSTLQDILYASFYEHQATTTCMCDPRITTHYRGMSRLSFGYGSISDVPGSIRSGMYVHIAWLYEFWMLIYLTSYLAELSQGFCHTCQITIIPTTLNQDIELRWQHHLKLANSFQHHNACFQALFCMDEHFFETIKLTIGALIATGVIITGLYALFFSQWAQLLIKISSSGCASSIFGGIIGTSGLADLFIIYFRCGNYYIARDHVNSALTTTSVPLPGDLAVLMHSPQGEKLIAIWGAMWERAVGVLPRQTGVVIEQPTSTERTSLFASPGSLPVTMQPTAQAPSLSQQIRGTTVSYTDSSSLPIDDQIQCMICQETYNEEKLHSVCKTSAAHKVCWHCLLFACSNPFASCPLCRQALTDDAFTSPSILLPIATQCINCRVRGDNHIETCEELVPIEPVSHEKPIEESMEFHAPLCKPCLNQYLTPFLNKSTQNLTCLHCQQQLTLGKINALAKQIGYVKTPQCTKSNCFIPRITF